MARITNSFKTTPQVSSSSLSLLQSQSKAGHAHDLIGMVIQQTLLKSVNEQLLPLLKE
ncbi:MAG: hypothetical protein M3270_09795 [Thermoproteota archaeon]|nr:hypothetical protein [Thermoproteota archaeon]